MTKFSDMLPEEVRAKFLMPKETLARVQALKHASAPVATLKMDNVTLVRWRVERESAGVSRGAQREADSPLSPPASRARSRKSLTGATTATP